MTPLFSGWEGAEVGGAKSPRPSFFLPRPRTTDLLHELVAAAQSDSRVQVPDRASVCSRHLSPPTSEKMQILRDAIALLHMR
ncbi:MAG: hypothetical protein DMG29_04510 [Acidobacteria bacterium]|nr:MAG: hypothetical protein DMG29_04510 [Acidobacteriota bacterium]